MSARAALLRFVAGATLVATAMGPVLAVSDSVVISQIYGGGETTGTSTPPAPYKNDFIELYNRSNQAVDLSNWSVQYASATGSSWAKANLTGLIPAGGYLLISGKTASQPAQGIPLPTPDITTTLSLSATDGKVALVTNQTALTGTNPSTAAGVADFVGYGTANGSETASAPRPTQATADLRLDGGCTDRDHNGIDFVVATPTPRNSATSVTGPCPSIPPGITALAVSPTRVDPGSPFTLTATMYTGTGAAGISSVTVDLTAVGGAASAPLSNGGVGNVYTLTESVVAGTTAGFKTLTVSVTDANGRTSLRSVQLTVNYAGGILTVAASRTLNLNDIFKVRGIVVCDSDGNPYIQDPDSAGTNNAGNMIFDGRTLDGAYPVVIGDEVIVTAYVGTFGNELEVVPLAPPGDIEVVSHGNPIPAPKILTIPDVNGNDTYEGMMVTINNLTVVSTNDANNPNIPVINGASAPGGFGSNSANVITLQDESGNQIGLYLHRNATPGATGGCDPDPANPSAPGYPGLTSNRPFMPKDPIPATISTTNGCGAASRVTFNAATANNGGVQTTTLFDVKVGNIFAVSGILGERTPPAGGGYVKLLRPRFVDDLVFQGVNVIIGSAATGGSPAASQFERGQVATLTVKTFPQTGSTVTADLGFIGGVDGTTLPYNPATGTHEVSVFVGDNAPLGYQNIPITAGNPGNPRQTANGQISVLITTPVDGNITNIAQFRNAPDYTKATLTGVVTANSVTSTLNYYIQDDFGGLQAFAEPTTVLANVGDLFTVTGYKDVYNAMVEIQYAGSRPTVGVGPGEPTPKLRTIAEYTPDLWGQLVRTTAQVVAFAPGASSGNAYTIIDGTGQTAELYIHLNAQVFDQSMLVPGALFDFVGICDRFADSARDNIRLKPRSASDIKPATSNPVIPTKLAFTVQPGGAQTGVPLSPQPSITVQSSTGATATLFNGPVNLSLKDANGAALTGTITVNAVNGIATFGNVGINLPGTYNLVATSPGLTLAESVDVIITPGAISLLDVQRALRLSGGIDTATPEDVTRLDKNADGSVTINDASALNRTLNGL